MIKNFKRELLIKISLILGSALIFAFGAYFLSDTITAEVGKITSDRSATQNRSDLIESLAQQKSSSPEVQKYQQYINLILPQKDDLVNYQSWLDGLSRVHQVSINFQFIGNTVPSNGTNPGHISFTLNTSGPYTNLTNFLRDVEYKDSHYTTKFDNFDVVRNGDTYGAAINGEIFFR